MAVSFRDLLERRVPQYLAVYFGAGWGLVEFFSFLEGRFSLSPAWTNLVLFAWALLTPSVVLFTYQHGRPGRDRWTRAELIGIPLNVAIAAVVLTGAFSGADLSATTTEVTVTDETGNTVERRVASAPHRRRLAIFDFTAPPDTALAWLGPGAVSVLGTDLAQDPFLDMRVSAHFREQLRRAGVPPGADPPLALKRRIADELHLPYFVTGSVSSGVEGITVRIELHDTESGRVVRERVSTHADMLRAIDELSVQIKQDLGLPATRPAGVQDLPVAALLTSETDALRALVEGEIAAQRDDWEGAEQEFATAVALDSTFAFAHYVLYQARMLRGDPQSGIDALDAAMRHLYRLPERMQFIVKADHYFVRRDMDRAFAVVGMMTELYPDDIQGHRLRAQLQTARNENRDAIASLRRVLELDPQQHEVLLRIGEIQEQIGDIRAAILTYQEYLTAFPDDVGAHLRAARAWQRVGSLDEARRAVDRALLIEPTNIEAALESAILHRNDGELEDAARLIEDAAALARTAEDRARVEAARASYFEFRGQLSRMAAAMERRLRAMAEYLPPINQVNARMSQLAAFVRAGQTARARAQLRQARSALSAPFENHWHIGQLDIAIATRDTVLLAEAVAGVTRVMQQFDFNFLEANLARADAALAEARGDWADALDAHRRALRLNPRQITANRDIARALRHLGRLDEATDAIASHLRAVPFAPESNVEAARIRLAAGDSTGARTHLERAAAMLAQADPGHATAREVRGLLVDLGR